MVQCNGQAAQTAGALFVSWLCKCWCLLIFQKSLIVCHITVPTFPRILAALELSEFQFYSIRQTLTCNQPTSALLLLQKSWLVLRVCIAVQHWQFGPRVQAAHLPARAASQTIPSQQPSLRASLQTGCCGTELVRALRAWWYGSSVVSVASLMLCLFRRSSKIENPCNSPRSCCIETFRLHDDQNFRLGIAGQKKILKAQAQ